MNNIMHMKIKLGFFVCGTAAAVLMCADVALGGVREQCAGVWKGGASGLAKETYLVLRADGTGAAFGVSNRGEQHKAYEATCGAPGMADISVTSLVRTPVNVMLRYRRPWEKDVEPWKAVHLVVKTIEVERPRPSAK